MDNAKIHLANKLQALWNIIKQFHEVNVRYLPLYSLFINSIEYIFHMFKQSVRQENLQIDKEALKQNIETFILTVTSKKGFLLYACG